MEEKDAENTSQNSSKSNIAPKPQDEKNEKYSSQSEVNYSLK